MKKVRNRERHKIERTVYFSRLEKTLWSLLSKCKESEYFEQMQKVFKSETCKYCCFEEVLENGILTAEERNKLSSLKNESFKEYIKKELRIVPNICFESPHIIQLGSNRSLQAHTIKIPTGLMQMRLHLISLFLTPLPYLKSFNNSFGFNSKKRLNKLENNICMIIDSREFTYGFSAKFEVCNSEHYLKTLKEHVPLPEWLINKLVKSKNLTVHQLFPETGGLRCIPTLEESLFQFWFIKFIQKVNRKYCRIFNYRDNILLLCHSKEEVEESINRFREAMPIFGIDFNYDSLEFFKIEDSFNFLGKTFWVEEGRAKSCAGRELFDSFLSYLKYLIESPLETIPIKEIEANKIILCFNLYYRGVPESFKWEFHNILKTFNLKVSDKSEILFLNDLLTRKDFEDKKAKVETTKIYDDFICPICGRTIYRGDEAVMLKTGKAVWYVHNECEESIYEVLKNLLSYSKIFPYEKQKLFRTLNGSNEDLANFSIKSNWIYYPLYAYFSVQKNKYIRLSFKELEEILGFELDKKLKDYKYFISNEGEAAWLSKAWEQAGYSIKIVKRFTGKITFERKKSSLKELFCHPLMNTEITSDIQKEVNQCIQSLIDSKTS